MGAGITTTLNARTSVLAAANPIFGRYNKDKDPHTNINLPAALLSRFDLLFLLLDTPEKAADELLAKHVASVHQLLAAPTTDFEPYDAAFIRNYISEAKKLNPIVPDSLHREIVNMYVEKRKEHAQAQKVGYMYVTPRTLIGIIRLAQAMARLGFRDRVIRSDIDEAIRLMDSSRHSLTDKQQDKDHRSKRKDPITMIFEIIKELSLIHI
eukprot:TRINITY_DN19286_c0_g1_i4.p2 TRINITY_DN19286_c0_g1~~TRINITY_DN19286_c0_g1_i4.p2  ORF type:complete len:210 (-),score=27.56 TRINITY_DN19286_c0_g1_i4:166-795(-)